MMPKANMFSGRAGVPLPEHARKLFTFLTQGKRNPKTGSVSSIMPVNTHITEYTVLPDGTTLQDKGVRHYLITVRYNHEDKYCLFSQNRRWNGKYWSPIFDRLYPESSFLFPIDRALKIASSVVNEITYYGMTYAEYSTRD